MLAVDLVGGFAVAFEQLTPPTSGGSVLALVADRVFDGERFQDRAMVLVEQDRVVAVDTSAAGPPEHAEVLDFGDATIRRGSLMPTSISPLTLASIRWVGCPV